jgi:hypothetical protein
MPWDGKAEQSKRPVRPRELCSFNSTQRLSRPYRPPGDWACLPRASACGLSPGLESPGPFGPVFVRGDQHDGSERGPEAYTSRAGRMSTRRNPDTIVLLAGELRRTRSNPEDRRRERRLPDLLRAAKIRYAGKEAMSDRGKSSWSKGPTI